MAVIDPLPFGCIEARLLSIQDSVQAAGATEAHLRLGSWLVRIVSLDFILGGVPIFDAVIVSIGLTVAAVLLYLWKKSRERRRVLQAHSITPRSLHDLLETKQKLTLLDLRLPLDLLAYAEIIPGAHWIAPSRIIADPTILPKDEDYVLYGTYPGENSRKTLLETAMKMGFLRVKLLSGGIEAWKQEGYPTEPYDKPFHLDPQ